MPISKPKKQFIIRKYIMAKSAAEALRIEKNIPADDCWISEEWMKEHKDFNDIKGFCEKYENK